LPTALIAAQGVEVRPMHIRSSHRSDIMTEVLDAGAVVVGSPTLNNNLFPTVADLLTYMKGLKPRKQDRRGIRILRLERGGGQAHQPGV
jgi:flavorubredoxin